jgi:hypothetical protein
MPASHTTSSEERMRADYVTRSAKDEAWQVLSSVEPQVAYSAGGHRRPPRAAKPRPDGDGNAIWASSSQYEQRSTGLTG